ncbi:MAG: hypothetical protein R3F39_22860 [Myxococcota bacterium]
MARPLILIVIVVLGAGPLAGCKSGGSGDDVAAQAAAVASCEYAQGYSLECPAYAAFLDSLDGGPDDYGLVALVEDPAPEKRWLGATGLARRGRQFHDDPALRGRLLEAARGEVDPAAAKALGAALARTQIRRMQPADAPDAALLGEERAALERLASEHPLPAMRAALLAELLGYGGDAWFDFTDQRLGNDTDAEVRRAGLAAFMSADPARASEVCAIWQRHADADPDEQTAAAAAKLRTTWGHCR